MLDPGLIGIFLAGLLGGTHCVGMCGGLVTAFALQLPSHRRPFPYFLALNTGRLFSYCLIGALLGGIAGGALALSPAAKLQQVLFIVANALLVAMGLYLAGISAITSRLELIGNWLWPRLQPLLRHFLPIRSVFSATAAGAIWGWLPCGLVYTAGLSALASASAWRGGLVMLAFGLGTLPNLLLMGVAAQTLRQWVAKRPLRLAAGLCLVSIGTWRLLDTIWYLSATQ